MFMSLFTYDNGLISAWFNHDVAFKQREKKDTRGYG